jgi:hypothetical protein
VALLLIVLLLGERGALIVLVDDGVEALHFGKKFGLEAKDVGEGHDRAGVLVRRLELLLGAKMFLGGLRDEFA